ncbi:hypothetical protein Tco_1042867 [Tanacetum coccineum]|uniref:Uncharacterized protein n=1 Tax=Tanacetum coccineum TaxID=301880 RepID=A0ABQ5GKF0_9ASTR
MPVKEAENENEAENGIKNEPIRKAGKEETTEAPSSQPVEYYLKHRINEKLICNNRSGRSKISFHRIPESLCKDEKGIKNNIEPIAPTMTVNS